VVFSGHAKVKAKKQQGFLLVLKGRNAIKGG